VIAIVDYGMGNLHSVRHAIEAAGGDACVTRRADDLRAAERIVLPGVGAFRECVENLRASGMVGALEEEILQRGKPMLGVCVGLQVMARTGEEGGSHPGLGWLQGVVRRLDVDRASLKVPHTGWNEVVPVADSPMFRGFRGPAAFYFTHSYHFVPDDRRVIAAEADYGTKVTAAVQFDNVFATQFHPEKSQTNGLRVLENFLAWKP